MIRLRLVVEADNIGDLLSQLEEYIDDGGLQVTSSEALVAIGISNAAAAASAVNLALAPDPTPSAATGVADPAAGTVDPPPTDLAVIAELDVGRIPHNEEYHAKNRAKLADGTWRLKRGCDKPELEAWMLTAVVPVEPAATVPIQNGAVEQPSGPLGAAINSGAVSGAATPPPVDDTVNRCLLLAMELYKGRTPEMFAAIGVKIQAACAAQGLADTNALINSPEVAPTLFAALQAIAQTDGIVDGTAARALGT